MLTAAWLKINRGWKLKSPSAKEWINTFQCIHIMEYYTATKRNKLLTHTTGWIKTLCWVKETDPKAPYCMIIHLIFLKRHDDRGGQIHVLRGWAWRGRGETDGRPTKGGSVRASFGGDGAFCILTVMGYPNALHLSKPTELYTMKSKFCCMWI